MPEVGAGGLDYTIRIRTGARWDTTPEREVTAEDFIRGFKRLCNPVLTAGAISYYTSTIEGMAEFAHDYQQKFAGLTASAIDLASFQNSHDISGLRAVNDKTLVIRLLRPANDMLNILSMIFASAAPAEYDEFVPDSPELIRNIRSNGPYRLTRYADGQYLTMERNPAWQQETDPIRHQYVERIEVRVAPVSDEQVRQAIERGEADLSWGAPVISQDPTPPDADRHLGYALNPYLVFNLRSPNERRATSSLLVRRAVGYAIDKASKVKFFDGMNIGTVTEPARTAIPPGNSGHRDYDCYPTPGDRGDPLRARALLAEAGYPDGLTLRALYRNDAVHGEIAESYAADLAAAGIEVELVLAGQSEHFYRILQDPARAAAGDWDIAAVAWTPDWFGNNGRAYVQPMFQSNLTAGTCNYGGYANPEVDRLILAALSEQDLQRADELWHQVDRLVIEDAAIVPIMACEPTIPHIAGQRVRNALPLPQVDRWLDAANLWLDPPG